MIKCTCGYEAKDMVMMGIHLGVNGWSPDDITAWVCLYATEILDDRA